jgi:DNA-directed RNA polymerase specialized sigma24 family protein
MVVLLTFYADRDSAGIGEDLGVTSGAVRTIRHRAMARLRDCVLRGARS